MITKTTSARVGGPIRTPGFLEPARLHTGLLRAILQRAAMQKIIHGSRTDRPLHGPSHRFIFPKAHADNVQDVHTDHTDLLCDLIESRQNPPISGLQDSNPKKKLHCIANSNVRYPLQKKKAVVESQIPKSQQKDPEWTQWYLQPPKTLTSSKHKWSISSADPVKTARSSPFGSSCPSPTNCSSRQQGREVGDVAVSPSRECVIRRTGESSSWGGLQDVVLLE